MPPLLYDQHGRPIERTKKPDRRPLAVAPLGDSFRDYVTDGLTPERLAAVFKEADCGNVRRQAELFEQLEEKDGHLLCERDKRRHLVLDLDFRVSPAAEDARSAKVAGFVEDFFKNHADWSDCKVALQDAVGKGYAALEPHWDISEGQAIPAKFEFLEQKRFLYTDPSGVLRRYPLLTSDAHPMGEEIPAWKTILHQYGGKSGHATRSGIYRVAAWMVLFKHYSLKDWVIFCEVFGMPLRIGKYDSGANKDDKDALIAAISSLGSDAAGIISKSTEIEFVDSVKQGKGDLYKQLADFCNAEVSKAVLGQTLTAQVGDTGSYAASNTHNEIRKDLLLADGRALVTTIRNQLVRPLVGFNFGWDTALPGLEAVLEEAEDYKAKAEWLDKVTSKVAVPAKWFRAQFKIPEQEKGEEMVGGPQPATVPIPAKRIAAKNTPEYGPEQQAIEKLADRAVEQVDLSGNEEKFITAVKNAASFEDAMAAIIDLAPDIDLRDLQTIAARAMTAAEIYGRKVAQDGAGD